MQKKKAEPSTTEKVFAFIVEYCRKRNGIPPTWQEIAAGADLCSTSVSTYHVKKLEKQGRLTYTPGERRSIEVRGGKCIYDENHNG